VFLIVSGSSQLDHYFGWEVFPSLLLTQSLQPCRCLSSRQLFTERIGCIGKWLSSVESYWTLQIPHPMDAGCDHFEWKNVRLLRYSPSKCVVSIPFSNIHHNVVSPRHGRETWFWKVSWQRRIRGGAKVLRETRGKSSSQVDTNQKMVSKCLTHSYVRLNREFLCWKF